MVKKLMVLQTVLLVLLGASIAVLGMAVYAAFRGGGAGADYPNARFVSAPALITFSEEAGGNGR